MSDESPVDLDAYFDRIGYGGSTLPTAQTLAELQRAHLAYIPFESMDAFLHRPVSIAPEDVDAKLIGARRGGMCFEHSGLFRRVLLSLGYEVTSLNGRGMWGTIRPRMHHALKVRAEGEDWLVEVGNAASTPTAPLQWRYDLEQATPHGPFRLVADGIETILEELKPEGWTGSYCLSPDPQLPWDFEPGNWWASAHPTSFYRNNLICTLAPADARVLLFNNRLTIRRQGAPDERHILDPDGVAHCLAKVFGLPVEEDWRPCIELAVVLGYED